MPALTMRGRYLMREYWSDSDLFMKLSAEQREVYQGLWMLADDDGWMPRDIPAIAASLYRFEDRAPREAAVKSALERLSGLGKVVSHRCCLHLPAVERYPRAGKKSREHHEAHLGHSKPKSVQTHSNGFDVSGSKRQTDLNPSPVVNPSLPDPSSRTGAPARGGAPSAIDESDFRRLVPLPASLGGRS